MIVQSLNISTYDSAMYDICRLVGVHSATLPLKLEHRGPEFPNWQLIFETGACAPKTLVKISAS